jgi:hypothetical protein
MKLIIQLPSEIDFGSSQIKCIGLIGTDAPDLNCTTDTVKKTITIDDAFDY